jgi:hypothetical protein
MYSRGDKENHEIDKYREVGDGEIAIATVIVDPVTGDKISTLPVSVVGGATLAKQDSQIALETALNTLINTLSEKVSTDDSLIVLRQIRTILYNHSNADGAKRQVVSINLPGAAVTTTLPVSGTVTATSNINQIGGLDPRFNVFDLSHIRYATAIRNNLIFT